MGICVGRCFVEGGPSTESLRTWRSKTYHGSDAGTTSGNRKSRMWDASSRSRDRSKVIPQTELSNFMDKVDMPGDELESFYTTLQVFKPTPRYTRRVSLNPSIGKILENSEMSSKYVEEDEEEENDTESEVSLPICPPVFPSEESRNTGSMDWGHSASPGPSRTSRRRSSGFNYDDECRYHKQFHSC